MNLSAALPIAKNIGITVLKTAAIVTTVMLVAAGVEKVIDKTNK